jgi:hypothetical protein
VRIGFPEACKADRIFEPGSKVLSDWAHVDTICFQCGLVRGCIFGIKDNFRTHLIACKFHVGDDADPESSHVAPSANGNFHSK